MESQRDLKVGGELNYQRHFECSQTNKSTVTFPERRSKLAEYMQSQVQHAGMPTTMLQRRN